MAVDARTHVPDARNLPGSPDHRGQLKRSWVDGIEDASAGRGLRRPGLDRRWPGFTWGDVGHMLGYLLGPLTEEEQNRLFEQAANWGDRNGAFEHTHDAASDS